jgi:hypothetical protein
MLKFFGQCCADDPVNESLLRELARCRQQRVATPQTCGVAMLVPLMSSSRDLLEPKGC